MKKTLLPLLVLVTAFVMASPAIAEVQGGTITISPFVGGYTFDGIQHLKTNVASGLRLGYNLTKNWGVEGQFTYAPLRSTLAGITTKGDLYKVGGDVLYHIMPENRLVPFVALGGGWSLTNRINGDNEDLTLDYGAGLKYFLNDWVALRGDVRHIFSFHTPTWGASGYWQNFEYTVGVSFQLGGARAATPVVKEEMPVKVVKAPTPAPVEIIPQPASVPAPVDIKPSPASVPTPVKGPNELILPGRLASPQAPAAVPAPEPVPAPAPGWEGPTSWMAEKTDVPEGKIMVVGFKIVQNAFEIMATGPVNYQVYTLAQPSRLVIDINNGLNGFRDNRILVNRLDIAAVRLEDTPDFLRIILDSAQENLLPYRIEETEKGLKVIVMKP